MKAKSVVVRKPRIFDTMFLNNFLIKNIFGFLFLSAALNLAAQEADLVSPGSARIYHAEGTDFAVSLDGAQLVFPAGSALKEPVILERSAVVNTGAGSFVEIQLIPSGTVIKVSDNTSLIYNGFDETGGFTDFGLLYGRIRIVSAGINALVVRSGAVSARIGEGDFGFDYMLEPGSQNSAQRPLFRLFAFRGGAEAFPYGGAEAYGSGGGGSPAGFGGAQTLTASVGESLLLDVSSSHTFAERKPIDNDMYGYWSLHNFAGNPPLPMPDTKLAAASPPESASPGIAGAEAPPSGVSALPQPLYEPPPVNPAGTKETNARPGVSKAKNTMFILGISMMLISAGVQGGAYYHYNATDNQVPRRIFTFAYIPMGFGLISALAGILYNPTAR